MFIKKTLIANIISCLILLDLLGVVYGAQYETYYFPITMVADANIPVLTSLYLQMDTIVYKTTLSEFSKNINSPEELAVKDIFETASKGYQAAFEKLLYFPKNIADSPEKSQFTETLMKSLKDYEEVYFQFAFGDKAVFLLGSQKGNRKNTMSLIHKNDDILFDFISPNTSVAFLFMSLLAKESLVSDDLYVREKPKCEYEMLLTDPNQAHSVKLLFNGRKYRSDEYMLLKDHIDQAASMVPLRRVAFLCGHEQGYAQMCTPLSRDRLIIQWNKSEKDFQSLYSDWWKMPRIAFVIDASPFYVVINQISESNEYEVSDYLWDDKANCMRPTDFGCMHFLKQILQGPSLKEFLGSIRQN